MPRPWWISRRCRNRAAADCAAWAPIEIRTLTTDEWALLRDTRFASLRDAPEAFTSTVEREEGYPPEVWQLRTGHVGGRVRRRRNRSGSWAGTGPTAATDTELVGMWVRPARTAAPASRRRLVEHVIAATAGRGR